MECIYLLILTSSTFWCRTRTQTHLIVSHQTESDYCIHCIASGTSTHFTYCKMCVKCSIHCYCDSIHCRPADCIVQFNAVYSVVYAVVHVYTVEYIGAETIVYTWVYCSIHCLQ